MSFGFTGLFRQGSYRDFRFFVLQQRRDVLARITTINAELARIGYIQIYYARSDPSDPTSRMTEARVGIDVTPHTSLAKLLQAYIAAGGNPFDISMFLTPDSFSFVPDPTPPSPPPSSPTSEDEDRDGNGNPPIPSTDDGAGTTGTLIDQQPYGGSSYSQSTDPIRGGLHTGGWLPLWRYPPRRLGSSQSYSDEAAEVARDINAMRSWVTQEIRTLRNDLEAKIIKLCDLREQLQNEANELIPQAVGGVIPGVNYQSDQHAVSHHVSSITDAFDSVFYPAVGDGTYDFTNPRTTTPNPEYPTLMDDAPNGEEDWCAIG